MFSQNKIFSVVGSRGSGKTPFIIGGDFERGVSAAYLKRGMSTLVIDEIDHPKYRHVPILHPRDYSVLSSTPGLYRTLVKLQDMDSYLRCIARDALIWNTAIVFEDCPKYIPRVFRRDIETTMVGNSKQQNCDIYFLSWGWKDTPADVCRKTNFFVVMKSADSPSYRKDDLPGGCLPSLIKAHNLVMSGRNKSKLPYIVVETPI